jgi:hypothetical protein
VSTPEAGFTSWNEWLADQGRPEDEWDDGAYLIDPAGLLPSISFLKVPEGKPDEPITDGATPGRRHNRLHLDIRVGEENHAEVVAQLIARGATKLWDGRQGPHTRVTMADPEGNEFCVA